MATIAHTSRRVSQCIIAMFLCVVSYGQTGALKKGNPDTAEINRLIKVAAGFTDLDSSINIYKELLSLGMTVKSDSFTNGFLLKLGEFYLRKGECVKAFEYTQQALHYDSSLSLIDQANDYVHLAGVYFAVGDYVSASENLYIALDLLKRSPVSGQMQYPIIYRLLGRINFRIRQDEKALFYFNLGEVIARRDDYKNLLAFILLSKGEYYTSLHKTDSAEECLNEAASIAVKINRLDIKAEANEGLGKNSIEAKDYSKAVRYLQLVVNDYRHIDTTIVIDASYYLAEAMYRMKKYNDAETILGAALKAATRRRLKDNALKGYATLAAVYKATGQYAKAMESMEQLNALKDSLVSADKAEAIDIMEIKYQTAQKDKQLANSQLLIALQNSEIARKDMWMFIIAGIVLLLLLASAGAYLHTLNRQRHLEKENKIVALKAAIQGGDVERARLARELHDGVGGMLSTAMIRLSAVWNNSAVAAFTESEYTEAMNILHEVGDEIRKTAHNLMPAALIQQSLPDAIAAYCNSLKLKQLKVRFQHYGLFDDLSQDYKLNIYRIIQELIKNIIQHAKAENAFVQLIRHEDTLIVSVEDDGVGFVEKECSKGQGLYNIKSRVRSIDGQFTLESKPGCGTSVFIEFKPFS